MDEQLTVFWGSYYYSGGYGFYDSADLIITANTESEALGVALSERPESKAEFWSFEKIDCTNVAATLISASSS